MRIKKEDIFADRRKGASIELGEGTSIDRDRRKPDTAFNTRPWYLKVNYTTKG